MMRKSVRHVLFEFICIASLLLAPAVGQRTAAGQDWPMWRYDASRSAASPAALPSKVQPLWTRDFPPPARAWDDPLNLDLMSYDRVLEPIVAGGLLMVSLSDRDQLAAFDLQTGKRKWTQFAEAPVRLPPAAHGERVYFCSDDGYLYCARIADGQLIWKFRGAPGPLRAIGNQRLVSAWPARGGPVVRDDTVYFAASIWPFMGTFLYALDAHTGQVRWVNDSTSAQYIKQPHSAPSFAGVAPQGALVATEEWLVVPGGRSVPAVFRRADGEFAHFEINSGGKGNGGSFVAANESHFFVHTRNRGVRAFDLAKGVKTAFMVNEPVLHQERIYAFDPRLQQLCGYDLQHRQLWTLAVDASRDLILAGNQLIAAGERALTAVELPSSDVPEQPPRVAWSLAVEQPVERLLVAEQKLFAVTAESIVAYGAADANHGSPEPARPSEAPAAGSPAIPPETERQAEALLDAGERQGYALWFGELEQHQTLLLAIARRSPFSQLAIVATPRDDSPAAVQSLRERLADEQRYGKVTVHAGTPESFAAPRYIAHQIVLAAPEGLSDLAIRTAYRSLRPYGGALCALADPSRASQLSQRLEQLHLEQARVERAEFGVIVRRVGPLPGAASWTHQNGDVANSLKSEDRRVQLPLGLLWFGGSSNTDVLPRHGHGPPEQVVGGRLFIEGINSLSARDVYTGRVLWKRTFKDLGVFDVYYDSTYKDTPLDTAYNQVHIPGANGRGTNYVVTEDRVYLLSGPRCLVLDPATGKSLQTIEMPAGQDAQTEDETRPQWGFLGVYRDVLIGGMGFANYRTNHGLTFPEDAKLRSSQAGFGAKSLDRAASRALVGFDRHSGKQLWRYDAHHSFWHNGIVAGGERIYALDRNPQQVEEAMRRRGIQRPATYRIVALDYRTGKPLWEHSDNVFGTWLGYSHRHDLLLQAGAAASDRLKAEVGAGMAVHHAATGKVSWRKESLKYAGPCVLHNDWIITNANSYAASAGAFRIDTGEQKMSYNSLTGQLQPWTLKRAYGCNNIIASEHLLTFRSGSAGFYDLSGDSGTGNLGGFKSGCTANLVAADGVLNAPDYTRTCSCAYQNQTSLALVHMPEMEMWTIHTSAGNSPAGRVRALGLNFGAPGDRRDDDGTVWLDYPVVGGDSPDLQVAVDERATTVRRHASTMGARTLPWVLASGLQGVRQLKLGMRIGKPQAQPEGGDTGATATTERRYRVRVLLTAAWDHAPAKFRVFLQGAQVIDETTLAGLPTSGAPSTGGAAPASLDRTFEHVLIQDSLTLRIEVLQGEVLLSGISVLEEQAAR